MVLRPPTAGQRPSGKDTLLLGQVALGKGEIPQAAAVRVALGQLVQDVVGDEVELGASACEDFCGIFIGGRLRGKSGLLGWDSGAEAGRVSGVRGDSGFSCGFWGK